MYLAAFSPSAHIELISNMNALSTPIADRIAAAWDVAGHVANIGRLLPHTLAGLFNITVMPGIWNGVCEPIFLVSIMKICVTDLAFEIAALIAHHVGANKLFIGSLHVCNLPPMRITEVHDFDSHGCRNPRTEAESIISFGRFLEETNPDIRIDGYFVQNNFVIPHHSDDDSFEACVDSLFEEYRHWLLLNEGIMAEFHVNHRTAHGILANRRESVRD